MIIFKVISYDNYIILTIALIIVKFINNKYKKFLFIIICLSEKIKIY